MKYFTLIFLFTYLSLSSFGQMSICDSLKKEFELCETDSCKSQETINIFDYWLEINQDSAKFYMQEYLEYFTSKKYDLGIVITSQNLAQIEKTNGNYEKSFRILNDAYNSISDDFSKIILLLNLAENNRITEDFETSEEQLKDAVN